MVHLICIGAQRAATTWLYRAIRDTYFDILAETVKEIHYFNQLWLPQNRLWCIKHRERQCFDSIRSIVDRVDFTQLTADQPLSNRLTRLAGIYACDATDNWYRTYVMHGNDVKDMLSLDFTPEYALLPLQGFKHMNMLCPNASYVFVLRDPIQRAYSHLMKLNLEEGLPLDPDSINSFILSNPDIIERSDYSNTIDSCLSVIEPGRLQLIFQDDIEHRPSEVFASIIDRLGLPSRPGEPEVLRSHVHVSRNSFCYTEDEVRLLKEIFWHHFSSCYNKLDERSIAVSFDWRSKADNFLSSLFVGP